MEPSSSAHDKATTLLSFTNAEWGSASHRRRLKWRYLIAASHHLTFFFGRHFPRTFPLVFVIGFPKSGTSWVCQLMADYLRLPFPQNSLFPIGFPAVVHGHETCSKSFPNPIYVVRDGRDAMTSLFFHVHGQSKKRVSTNHAAEFEEFVRRQLRHPTGSPVNWGDHVRSYFESTQQHHARLVRYESLLADPAESLASVIEQLTGEPAHKCRLAKSVDRFAFAAQRGRDQQENRASYLRKGKAGDWRNHFTPAAAAEFADSCGDMLVAAGYESDHRWLSTIERNAA